MNSSVPWGTSRPPPSRPRPCTCQRSAAQTGWFCWVKEARGQWVPTVATYFLLGGDTFLQSCRPPQPPPSPIPAPTPGKLTVTQRGLWSLRLIELLRVACHFCACGLQICLTKRATPPPGRGEGEEPAWGTAQSSPPTGHGGLGPTQQTSAWGPRGLPFHPSSSPGEGWRKQTERFSFYEPI